MGIDWARMRPKDGSDRSRLEALAKEQARAFQSMPWYWEASGDETSLYSTLSPALHQEAYRSSSQELSSLLELPDYDQEAGACTDLPALAGSWRIGTMSHNAVIPPLWRMEALRTILPGEVLPQLIRWREWIERLRAGEQRAYLVDMFLHSTSRTHRTHWNQLVDLAYGSLEKETKWGKKPELVEVREQVLHFPRPAIPDLAPEPPTKPSLPSEEKLARAAALADAARQLVRLTRAWDSKVKSAWKLRWYEKAYRAYDVDSFLTAATDRLEEFFSWVEECDRHGFGLYLHY